MVAFDLDGTLVDSVPDIAWSGDEMLRQLGLPIHGEQAARNWVGNGIERFVKRMLTGDINGEPDAGLFEKALPLYREIYASNICRYSSVYPGVIDCLNFLKNSDAKLSCITNKAGAFTEKLLEQIGLAGCFELVVAGDTVAKRKPHPLPLQHAAQQLNVIASDSLMVGDSKNDVLAARAAGFGIVCRALRL